MNRRTVMPVAATLAGGLVMAMFVLVMRPSTDAERPMPASTPAMTVTTTPAPPLTLIGDPGRIPTGDAGLDAFIQQVTSGDADAVITRIEFAEEPCQITGYGPRCDALGLTPGTVVRGLPMGDCDVGLVAEERVRDSLTHLLWRGGEPLRVWGIYQPVNVEMGDAVLMFTTTASARTLGPTALLHLRDGRLIRATGAACVDRVPGDVEVERWLVHPADLRMPLEDPTPTPVASATSVSATATPAGTR